LEKASSDILFLDVIMKYRLKIDELAQQQKNEEIRATLFNVLNILTQEEKPSAEYLIQKGFAYLRVNKVEQAIEYFNKALELNPNFAEAYIKRGNSYYSKQDYDRAIADYDQALAINPNYIIASLIRP
jgi:tetratricopeptide (TPR) repeat protein